MTESTKCIVCDLMPTQNDDTVCNSCNLYRKIKFAKPTQDDRLFSLFLAFIASGCNIETAMKQAKKAMEEFLKCQP